MSAFEMGAYQNESGCCFLSSASPWPPFTWGDSVPLLHFSSPQPGCVSSAAVPSERITPASPGLREEVKQHVALGGGAG